MNFLKTTNKFINQSNRRLILDSLQSSTRYFVRNMANVSINIYYYNYNLRNIVYTAIYYSHL